MKVISGNACYHSVQNLSFPQLLFKTIILHVVLYGSETWFLTLREEHRLMVVEENILPEER
jgi:hypothetical protein